MHKLRGLYEQIYDYDNLYQAYLAARKNKRFRPSVLEFTNDLEANLIKIQNDLIWGTYQIGPYREFYVYEPKLRLIMALPFRDRVVQWAIYRVLNPQLDKRYISDSYACRPGHGAHRNRIVGRGMPVGNLTSQMAANLYLNEADQFIKHELRIRRYMRYMDDMVILHHDKQHLWSIKREVEGFLVNNLHLDLNSKTTVRSVNQGVEWVGYRVWPTHIKLRKSTAQKMRKRLRYLRHACACGHATLTDLNASWQSYRGMLKHCNSYRLERKLADEMNDMLVNQEVSICQNSLRG